MKQPRPMLVLVLSFLLLVSLAACSRRPSEEELLEQQLNDLMAHTQELRDENAALRGRIDVLRRLLEPDDGTPDPQEAPVEGSAAPEPAPAPAPEPEPQPEPEPEPEPSWAGYPMLNDCFPDYIGKPVLSDDGCFGFFYEGFATQNDCLDAIDLYLSALEDYGFYLVKEETLLDCFFVFYLEHDDPALERITYRDQSCVMAIEGYGTDLDAWRAIYTYLSPSLH